MNQEDTYIRRTKVALSCQQALLRSITPNIRTVVVGCDEKNITLYFVYDGPISEDDIAETDRVASKMRVDFPADHLQIKCLRVDFPVPKPLVGERTIYSRKETSLEE